MTVGKNFLVPALLQAPSPTAPISQLEKEMWEVCPIENQKVRPCGTEGTTEGTTGAMR